MKKVVTFGEIMLRLAPEGYYRFVQADTYGATFGGGEANVAVSLANYGIDAKFVTKLPCHEIGQSAVNSLRKYGVDTQFITRGGDRVGIYYLEKGASQRPSKVIYDRAGSAIAKADPSDFDWDKIFDGVDWFHFTGITPALGDNVAQITLEAVPFKQFFVLTENSAERFPGLKGVVIVLIAVRTAQVAAVSNVPLQGKASAVCFDIRHVPSSLPKKIRRQKTGGG